MSGALWTDAIERIQDRIRDTGRRVTSGFPHVADPEDGEWTTSPAGDWTGGFWNGLCWLGYHGTRDPQYLGLAERWTELLPPRARSETIFRGFLFWYGAAIGAILLDHHRAGEVALEGARGLATLYDPVARCIPLGSEAEEATNVGRTETNIDGVMGATLLAWAARRVGGDEGEQLRRIAIDHADRHIELCVRADASVCQSARFDPATGRMLARYTHKGFTDDSTWTRAQAWGMVGYTLSAQALPDQPQFLATAMRTADWWIGHIPPDLIASWDFDAPPGPETPRDTSGTAIATAALLKLAALAPDATQRQEYRRVAERTAEALVRGYLTPTSPEDIRAPGILTQGCYNHRTGLATEHELIWGDYYLFESLQVLAGRLDPTAI